MAWTMSAVERFIDPDFGPDPYFKRVAGRAECSEEHLKHMFRTVWPFLASVRIPLVGQRDMTSYMCIGRFAVGDRDHRQDGSVRYGFGHVYFLERPGTGKSLLAKVPGLVLDADVSRFQGMAGTLPADYTGNRMIQIDEKTGRRIFELVRGPAFTQIKLLDEFFRSDERTQGAALEDLGEGTVTIAGVTYPVDSWALITGNPIETKGVFPAIAAFLDRIMFTIRGQWFTAHDFGEILRRTGKFHQMAFKKICDMKTVKEVQQFFHENIHVSDEIRDNAIGRFAEITNDPQRFGFLKRFTRMFDDQPIILGGLSGRGVCHWEGAAKVLAAMRYRNYVIPADARKVLPNILRLRIRFAPNVLRFFAEELGLRGNTTEAADVIIKELIQEAW